MFEFFNFKKYFRFVSSKLATNSNKYAENIDANVLFFEEFNLILQFYVQKITVSIIFLMVYNMLRVNLIIWFIFNSETFS